jgi:excinuclease ABC subunit A
MAPVVRGRKGAQQELFEELRREGFARLRVDGEQVLLDEVPALDKRRNHTIEVVVDRLVVSDTIRTRLTDSVELALKRGSGLVIVLIAEPGKDETEKLFSELNACAQCQLSFEELKPRNFSFNNPHGACPACAGLGAQLVFIEDLVVPNKELSLADGAIHPWRHGGYRMVLYHRHLLREVARNFDIDMATPYKDLPRSFRQILMHGTGDKEIEIRFRMRGVTRKHQKPFEGVLPALHRQYTETDFEEIRERLQQYMTRETCPVCKGARLRPEPCAATVGGVTIVDLMSRTIAPRPPFSSQV